MFLDLVQPTKLLRPVPFSRLPEERGRLQALIMLQVRGDEKWLPAKFAALQELSLRGRPRSFMVPPSCTTLSLAYHVSKKLPCDNDILHPSFLAWHPGIASHAACLMLPPCPACVLGTPGAH